MKRIALILTGLAVSVVSSFAAIVPNVGTLNTGGADVSNVAEDAVTLLNFCANSALALFVCAIVIAIGWKVYRFFKPAR